MEIRRNIAYALIVALSFAILLFGVNWYMVLSTQDRIHRDITQLDKAPIAIVLGASVLPENRVSQIVYDRIIKAVELYQGGYVDRILVSGDSVSAFYDEVNTIDSWLRRYGIPKEHIFLDPEGLSTQESMVRASSKYNIAQAIVVTQEFHLARAVYLAQRFGIEAQGYVSDRVLYRDNLRNQIREFFARIKDFFTTLF